MVAGLSWAGPICEVNVNRVYCYKTGVYLVQDDYLSGGISPLRPGLGNGENTQNI